MSNNFSPVQWIHPRYGDWPSFSPDGSQVVFTLDNALFIMNSDGTDLKRLYPPEGTSDIGATRPDWSWNPDLIAFTYNAREIWTIHPDGSGAALYCRVPVGWNLYYPSWCQDLKALIAVGYNEANTQAETFRLTPDSVEVLTTSPDPCAGRPSVSPDGKKIAFAGNWGKFSQVQNQIWVVEPPGKPFHLEKGEDLSAIQGRSPSWSPQGDLIVFESTRPFLHPGPGTPLAIWVMNSDGTNPRQLTDRARYSAFHAEWSRQQTRIVFAGQGMGIGIMEYQPVPAA